MWRWKTGEQRGERRVKSEEVNPDKACIPFYPSFILSFIRRLEGIS
jgi:hypothetical protein